ncbi:hypothetical protein L1049_015224 [Liquidambar formosana]|uniref:GRF-type domain-containing protein n=1 Tax=Liquidambar formosana TaxID=63359 RepID=A0AAP0S3X7_LIQFO
MNTPEDSEPKCSCGLSAKLRMSRTFKNPYRLFYNCSKDLDDQCNFFCWFDELSLSDDKPIEELTIVRDECIQLQQRLVDIQQEYDNNRIVWNREKLELTSQLSTIQAELDDIKKKIKLVNESDLMPPVNKLLDEDDGADDAVVINTIETVVICSE